MWAALTALFVVLLVTIACSLVWIVANVVGFLQPILIPVAIAVILAYLLDPLVTKMTAARAGADQGGFRAFHDRISFHRRVDRVACADRFHAGRQRYARAAPIHAESAR